MFNTVSLLSIKSAAFSPIMMDGAFVFPDVTVGITEASATLKFSIPRTLQPTKNFYHTLMPTFLNIW